MSSDATDRLIRFQPFVGIQFIRRPAQGGGPFPRGPGKDLLSPVLVDAGKVFGGVFGFAVPVILANPRARIPPVEVPAIRSKQSTTALPTSFSFSASARGRNQAPDAAAVNAEDGFHGWAL
jgi:hypothetical protein